MLLGGATQRQQQPHFATQQNIRADLSTSVTMNNAFSISLKISDMGRGHRNEGFGNKTFEFGPYQGQNMESGYRLVYQAGALPALKLIRYQRNTSAVIEVYDNGKLLSNGNIHTLNWQRIMQVRDHRYRDAFNGFVMTNRGGDYAIRSVSIYSSDR